METHCLDLTRGGTYLIVPLGAWVTNNCGILMLTIFYLPNWHFIKLKSHIDYNGDNSRVRFSNKATALSDVMILYLLR